MLQAALPLIYEWGLVALKGLTHAWLFIWSSGECPQSDAFFPCSPSWGYLRVHMEVPNTLKQIWCWLIDQSWAGPGSDRTCRYSCRALVGYVRLLWCPNICLIQSKSCKLHRTSPWMYIYLLISNTFHHRMLYNIGIYERTWVYQSPTLLTRLTCFFPTLG